MLFLLQCLICSLLHITRETIRGYHNEQNKVNGEFILSLRILFASHNSLKFVKKREKTRQHS